LTSVLLFRSFLVLITGLKTPYRSYILLVCVFVLDLCLSHYAMWVVFWCILIYFDIFWYFEFSFSCCFVYVVCAVSPKGDSSVLLCVFTCVCVFFQYVFLSVIDQYYIPSPHLI
jgi:hypothetical protein